MSALLFPFLHLLIFGRNFIKKDGEWGKIRLFFPKYGELIPEGQPLMILEGWGLCTWPDCSGVPSLIKCATFAR